MMKLYISSPLKGDGKTFLSAGLAATLQSLGYRTSVYKPVQMSGTNINGFAQSPDLTYIKSVDPYINTQFTYLFKDSTEPVLAAEAGGKYIDIDIILKDYNKLNSVSDCTIVDGTGGLLTPLSPNCQNADLIRRMNVPILFTVKPDYNSVNNILSAINTAKTRGLIVNGAVINNIDEDRNSDAVSLIRIIEEYTDIKVLGLVPNLKKPSPQDLITGILNGIDIESVFGIKIEKLDFE